VYQLIIGAKSTQTEPVQSSLGRKKFNELFQHKTKVFLGKIYIGNKA
jgi:hypothetical protein